MSTVTPPPFDPLAPLPPLEVVEASAGTGKTWNLATLVTRLVAGDAELEPVPVEGILVVTYTRAATGELRDRIRTRLVHTAAEIEHPRPDEPDPLAAHLAAADREGALRRLQAAIAGFDAAPVLTIHGFCQLALRTAGLANRTAGWELTDDAADLVAEVCHDHLAELGVHDGEVGRHLDRLTKAVTACLANPTAEIVPPEGDTAGWWVECVRTTLERLEARHARRGELTYTGLLEAAHRLVTTDPGAEETVATLRRRFPVACIDEFQDTDPLQWALFRRIYGEGGGVRLVAVGDPKQAIYAFRGADVQTYRAARDQAEVATLTTNWRADGDLVEATNRLLRRVPFGPGITMPRGVARQGAPARGLQGTGAPAPVRLRMLVEDAPPAARADAAVVADLVREATSLLAPEAFTIPAGPRAEHGRRALRPDDLAVLVRSRLQADRVQQALLRAGIPAVRAGAGSVFATAAAHQWRLLLAASERPSSPGLARAAACGWFFSPTAHQVATWTDDELARQQEDLADLAHLLRERGLPSLLARLRAQGLDERILGRPGGERDLTDLDHVAELLVTDARSSGARGAAALRSRLTALMAAADEDDDSEGSSRRVDADDRAVQVLTVHAAKGLEFPVVLVPFGWKVGRSDGPVVLTTDRGRVIDLAKPDEWPKPARAAAEARKAGAAQERREEELRLLYVALTRAVHHVTAWYVPQKPHLTGPIERVLFEDDPATAAPADASARLAHLRSLHGVAEGLLEVGIVDPAAPLPAVRHSAATPPLSISTPRPHLDRAWRRWSFTSLAARGEQGEVHPAPHSADDEIGANDPPPPGEEPPPVAPLPLHPPMPLATVPGGTRFGTLVHELLERVDVATADREHLLAAAVDAAVWQPDLLEHREALVAGLLAAAETPLGPWAGGRSLADVPWDRRLRELTFDLPLATRGEVRARALGELLLAGLGTHDPVRGYAEQLASDTFDLELRGFLTGSIDLVLGLDERFAVADYKTNLLHRRDDTRPLEAYHPDRLPAAMAHHHYPLQALLYLVAIHRYLRWRLPGYDPERNLGGAAYLFVRGMVGAATPLHDGQPYGVFRWAPPPSLVVAASELLDGGRR